MTSKVTRPVAVAGGTGVDLRNSHRGNPDLVKSVKEAAASQLTNPDRAVRSAPIKLEKKVTRDSAAQYLSDTESSPNAESSAERTEKCFIAAKQSGELHEKF